MQTLSGKLDLSWKACFKLMTPTPNTSKPLTWNLTLYKLVVSVSLNSTCFLSQGKWFSFNLAPGVYNVTLRLNLEVGSQTRVTLEQSRKTELCRMKLGLWILVFVLFCKCRIGFCFINKMLLAEIKLKIGHYRTWIHRWLFQEKYTYLSKITEDVLIMELCWMDFWDLYSKILAL